ncbi:MAG: 4-(cytidine 5'-diphospho)-2-C-methyl-D-erythritol kinase [Candidatus Melainabacteria bacterium GWF2_37_15]|nr:MAG: 4-(cytidine 5'-diphospho)-2-C-methyl-D-erythritol kinase [Candidatus Melainabacteria bacterium GWF2_37_15]
MQTLKVKTPGKIDLMYEITGIDYDGFHTIESVMQEVDLYDTLTITVEDYQGQGDYVVVTGNNPNIPYNDNNYAKIAAKAYLRKANINGKKVTIDIDKHLPAGLGGASSNAAGVLKGLNHIFGNRMDDGALEHLASEIKSNVHFFLKGGTQYARGKGDELQKLPTPCLKLVVARPIAEGVSKKEAYDRYDKLDGRKPENHDTHEMINAVKENNIEKIASEMHNVLEEAVFPVHPQIAELKQKLIQKGCLNAEMSETGPSVVGIYTDSADFSDLQGKNQVYQVFASEKGILIE